MIKGGNRLLKEDRILLLDLLQVLHEHTDEEHSIKQNEIIDILEREYGYENLYQRRRTIKNNIDKLIRYNESNNLKNISAKPSIRKMKSKITGKIEEVTVYSDFVYEHDFTHEELYLIIDGILFSKQIPSYQRKDMIEKLEKLTSKHFKSRLSRIDTIWSDGPINKQLFYNIKILDESMSQSKQVSFNYNNYVVDEKSKLVLQPRTNQDGVARKYLINPYRMVATNGRYYLICNNDKYDNISHYRLDRMTNIQDLDKDRKSHKEVKGLEHGLDLSKHMKEHIYMFAGESVMVKMRFNKHILSEFIDWFSTDDIDFSDQTEDEVTVSVRVNQTAMRKWALQYAIHVRVLSPSSLVEEIKQDIKLAMQKYE